jgi:hypothetical protein
MRASGSDAAPPAPDDTPPASDLPTTPEDAYAALGLDPASVRTFEDVLAAKNAIFDAAPEGAPGSAQRRARAEAAYDLLLMRDMRRRLSGETEVSASVRYADVGPASSGGRRGGSGGGGGGRGAAAGSGGGLGALFGGGGGGSQSAGRGAAVRGIRAGASVGGGRARAAAASPGLGLAVRPVAGAQAGKLAAVFGGLAALALAGALLETPEQQLADVAPLPLALAGAAGVYFLRGDKRLSLARSSGITAGAALAGVLLGSALNAWLRVDIVPLGNFGSPGVLLTDSAILAIWAACALLE